MATYQINFYLDESRVITKKIFVNTSSFFLDSFDESYAAYAFFGYCCSLSILALFYLFTFLLIRKKKLYLKYTLRMIQQLEFDRLEKIVNRTIIIILVCVFIDSFLGITCLLIPVLHHLINIHNTIVKNITVEQTDILTYIPDRSQT